MPQKGQDEQTETFQSEATPCGSRVEATLAHIVETRAERARVCDCAGCFMSSRGWEHVTMAEVTKRELAQQAKGSKYHAVKTTVDGITFDSAKEARRYSELMVRGLAGEIRNLEFQPRFELTVDRRDWRDFLPVRLGEYRADFQYEERERWLAGQPHDTESWRCVVEDVKGFQTPLFRWKRKHVEAQYGIKIRLIQ